MNWKARIQAWSTLAAVLALPLLYVGGTQHALALSIIGIVIFTASLLICPALRFVRPARPAAGAGARPAHDVVATRR